MRSLTRLTTYRPNLLPRPTLQHATLTRPFSTTPQLRLRENQEHDPQDLENKKEQAKHGSKPRDLQSAGEEAVGADQEKVKDDKQHIEELQKETAKESQKEKEGKK